MAKLGSDIGGVDASHEVMVGIPTAWAALRDEIEA
jgi:hypothetical protein